MNNSTETNRNSSLDKMPRKRMRHPTEQQLNTWEVDGGTASNSQEEFEVISGIVCKTTTQKLRAKIRKYLNI